MDEIFNFGLQVCLGFVALDVVLLFLGKDVAIIPVYSKIMALVLILSFKYNVKKGIMELYPRLRR